MSKGQQHSLWSTGPRAATCRSMSGEGLPGRGGQSCVALWAKLSFLQPISRGARLAGKEASGITSSQCPQRGGRGQERFPGFEQYELSSCPELPISCGRPPQAPLPAAAFPCKKRETGANGGGKGRSGGALITLVQPSVGPSHCQPIRLDPAPTPHPGFLPSLCPESPANSFLFTLKS